MKNNYKNELNKMYDDFYCCDGKCSCFTECSKNMENGARINCCKLKLGEKYGETNPRIMFVGKENVGKDNIVSTPPYISDVPANNIHYIGTIHTAAYILGEIDDDRFLNLNLINQGDLMELKDLSPYFCLTNYYKCAFKEENGNNHNVSTNKTMSKRCPSILVREIDVLRPNLIIMQGKFSSSHFWGKRNGKLFEICEKESKELFSSKEYNISAHQYTYRGSSEKLNIVYGYHPASHGRLWHKSLNSFKQALDIVLSI